MSIWLNPVIQPEELLREREIRNACDLAHNTHAVAVHKTIDRKIKNVECKKFSELW